MVALDHRGSRDLTLFRTLPGRPDIHQEPAGLLLSERLRRGEPVQPGARLGEDLLDRTRAFWTGRNRHYAADQAVAASVPSDTSPD